MIEYFYSAHSAFAYFGSTALTKIAREAGAEIVHKPMDLRRVVAAAKGADFKGYGDAHMAYFFGVEIDRWAEYRDAPVMGHMPTHHAKEIETSNCFLIAAIEQNENVERLAHILLEAHWRDDADLADAATLVRLADAGGFDGAALLDGAKSSKVHEIYEKNTDEAIARSVFGSPAYVVEGEMFYGQDRLDFVKRALTRRGPR